MDQLSAITGKGVKKAKEEAPITDLWNGKYVDKSLGHFTLNHKLRVFCIGLLESPWWERVIIVMIIINCVFLALMEPTKADNEGRNRIIADSEVVFTAVFTVEMCVKILAMGLWSGESCYLRDGWNVMDFIVVLASLAGMLPGLSSNFSSIRTVRVLRPLRTISALPGMRVLVGTMIKSLPMLGNVMLLCMFLFVVFGILGVQLFKGKLRNRCYDVVTDEVTDVTITFLQPPAERKVCTNSSWPWQGRKCGAGTSCLPYGNPNYGVTSFDNILWAFVTIFQCITLEGWVYVMYDCMDATSGWSFIYFLWIILLGSFFLLNLALGVITDVYDETENDVEMQEEIEAEKAEEEAREEAKRERERLDHEKTMADDAMVAAFGVKGEGGGGEEEGQWEVDLPEDLREFEKVQSETPKAAAGDLTIKMICRSVIDTRWFFPLMIVLIGVNTILLAMEYHGMPRPYKDGLDRANLTLTIVFAVEMVLKIVGLGVTEYARDRFNVFDAVVVLVSIVELMVSSNGSLSALRAFRILRVMKLIRAWQSLQKFLMTIYRTIAELGNFTFVVALVVFIYALLGMRLFGGHFDFEDGRPRAHFDTILWAVMTVFQILTGEDWNSVMYDGVRAVGSYACVYFISLMVIGNYFVLNLFVAILLSNLREDDEAADEEKREAAQKHIRTLAISSRFSAQLLMGVQTRKEQAEGGGSKTPGSDDARSQVSGGGSFRLQSQMAARWQVASAASGGKAPSRSNSRELLEVTEEGETGARRLSNGHSEPGNSRPGQSASASGPNFSSASGVGGSAEGGDDRDGAAGKGGFLKVAGLAMKAKHWLAAPQKDDDTSQVSKLSRADRNRLNSANRASAKELAFLNIGEGVAAPEGAVSAWGGASLYRLDEYEYNSFYIFSVTNPIRRVCFAIADDRRFEYVVMCLIVISSVCMAYETPYQSERTTDVLNILDITFTLIFALEMAIKSVAFGMIRDDGAYLKDPWNVMDGIIVVLSLIGLSLSGYDFSWVRGLRTMRVLRPLRVISRVPELKLVVNALFRSLKDLGNVLVVSAVFWLIFGILGMQLFMGKFYRCNDPSVEGREQCRGWWPEERVQREWILADTNFDNIFNAMLALFEMSTTEGWTAVMYNGVDARGVDLQPQRDHNEVIALFFFAFMIVGSFFILNLFIGIIIDSFSQQQRDNDGSAFLTPEQRSWMEAHREAFKTRPTAPAKLPDVPTRRQVHTLVTKKWFDYAIMWSIGLNTFVMMLEHYDMNSGFHSFISVCNYVFTIEFAIEALLKLYAFYPSLYFAEPWNRFDFVVVLFSLVGVVTGAGSGASALRVFRVARVFRLVKELRGLKMLFTTLLVSVPTLINVGALMFLLFFIYSVLGVNLFGRVKLQETLDEHANFTNFGYAMLILLRMSTGEAWNTIMAECTVAPPDCDPRGVKEGGLDNCGKALAPFYFVSFVILGSFIFLNLVIAVVLENFSSSKNADLIEVTTENIAEFRQYWAQFDPYATMFVPLERFTALLREVPPPLGLKGVTMSRKAMLVFQDGLKLTVTTNYLYYHDVLTALTRKAVGVESEDLPDEVRKAMALQVAKGRVESEKLARAKIAEEGGEVGLPPMIQLRAEDGDRITMGKLYSANIIQAATKGFLQRKRQKMSDDKRRRDVNVRRATTAVSYIMDLLDSSEAEQDGGGGAAPLPLGTPSGSGGAGGGGGGAGHAKGLGAPNGEAAAGGHRHSHHHDGEGIGPPPGLPPVGAGGREIVPHDGYVAKEMSLRSQHASTNGHSSHNGHGHVSSNGHHHAGAYDGGLPVVGEGGGVELAPYPAYPGGGAGGGGGREDVGPGWSMGYSNPLFGAEGTPSPEGVGAPGPAWGRGGDGGGGGEGGRGRDIDRWVNSGHRGDLPSPRASHQ